MRKTQKTFAEKDDDMLSEYDFDLSKAKPNRFASKMSKDVVVIVLDPDVSKVFRTSESVNRALRAMIDAMPAHTSRKRARKVEFNRAA